MSKASVFFLLLLIVPFIVGSNVPSCPLTLSSKLLSTGRRYNTYLATITNPLDTAASDIVFSTSANLHSIDDVLTVKAGFMLDGQTTLNAQETYSFTFQVVPSTPPQWSITCVAQLPASSTVAPTFALLGGTAAPARVLVAATVAATVDAVAPAPTVAPTVAPTAARTVAATVAPAPTVAPTVARTVAATAVPTAAPNVAATVAPTVARTAPTVAPTAVPASSTSGKKCPAGSWWRPKPTTTWQWQLTGTIDTSLQVQMYDIDLFDNAQSVIDTLHSQGKVVICYISTQYEDWRPDVSSWTAAVLGANLGDWAGEKYVDIRSSTVRNIFTARLDLAVSKGCDGVEPDNVDGYTATSGFPLTAADQLDFNQFIATEAHKRGLSVGLKNDVDQAVALQPYFDWALNEECYHYKECSNLNAFITNKKAVFNCEYSGTAATLCPVQDNLSFSTLMKGQDLKASIVAQCCTFSAAGCVPASYDCVSS